MLSCAAVKRAMVATVVTASLLAACSTGDDGGSGTTTRPKATHTTMSPDEAAVRKVAEEWRQALLRLGRNPNSEDPDLRRYLTGDLLGRYQADIARQAKEAVVVRAPRNSVTKYTIEQVRVDGDTATLQECSVNDLVVVSKRTGKVLNDEVKTRELKTVAKKVNGQWKLSMRSTSREWQGVAGCAG